MAIDGNVLDSFFIALGFKVDPEGIKKFQTSFDQLRETALHFAEALALPALANFVEDVAKSMGEMRQFAQVQKLSTAELWAWNRVANENRISAEEMEQSIGRLNRNVGQAALGYGRAKQIFQKLGLAAKDSRGHTKSFDVVLGELAQKMQHLSRSENLGIAARLGLDPKMIPLLERGRDALHGLIEEARRENPFTDQDFADADKIDRMWRVAKEDVEILWQRLAVKLFPVLRQVLGSFMAFYRSLNDGSERAAQFARALDTVRAVAQSVFEDFQKATSWLIKFLAWMGDNAPVWAMKDALYALLGIVTLVVARFAALQALSLVQAARAVIAFCATGIEWFTAFSVAELIALFPIYAIIIAVTALATSAYLVYAHWNGIIQWFGHALNWINEKVAKLTGAIGGLFNGSSHGHLISEHTARVLHESEAARGQTPTWAAPHWGSQSFNKSHTVVQHVTGTQIHVSSPDPEKAGEKVKEALRNDTNRRLVRNSQGFAF